MSVKGDIPLPRATLMEDDTMRRSTVLSQLFASLLALTFFTSTASADVTAEGLKNAFLEASQGLAAVAKADADVAVAQTAYDAAVVAMSTPAVLTAIANIERLQITLEALATAKANGANVALAITAAETELAAAKAIVDAAKPAFDAAEAKLIAALATAEAIKTSYENAFVLLATAITEPNTETLAEIAEMKIRLAYLGQKLQRANGRQARVNADLQEQIDENGETTQALIRELDDASDENVGLQTQIDELRASDAKQFARIDTVEASNAAQNAEIAAARAFISKICPNMKKKYTDVCKPFTPGAVATP